ncbi:unnamed protein product [Soboliphyme baturini]|uniref:LSM14 domain-containing protein n=1 Tax=Soboliphyme baturini TaxID=241478 RepID=A0A183IPQ3_9BILA|nr:unnamed protein product [Soboliphyme baturini]
MSQPSTSVRLVRSFVRYSVQFGSRSLIDYEHDNDQSADRTIGILGKQVFVVGTFKASRDEGYAQLDTDEVEAADVVPLLLLLLLRLVVVSVSLFGGRSAGDGGEYILTDITSSSEWQCG